MADYLNIAFATCRAAPTSGGGGFMVLTRCLLPAAVLLAACRVTAPPDCTNCAPDEVPIDTTPPDTAPPDTARDDTAPHDTGPFDADADGYTAVDDCDDTNASVHPEAEEGCDLVDNDCDGLYTECTVDGADSLVENDDLNAGWMAATFAGDLDADGREEVLLTAYTERDYSSQTRIVCGARVEPGENTLGSAECAFSQWAQWLAPVGDADGDGTSDLAIITNEEGAADRQIALVRGFDAVFGEVSANSASAWLTDTEPGSRAYLNGPGADIDGDGLLEFEYRREWYAGVVVSPAGFESGGTVAEWGWEFDMESGSWATVLADIDGDGLADVSTVGSGVGEPDTIRVYSGTGLVLGARYDRTAADVTISATPDIELGPCPAVDVDGDGIEELQGITAGTRQPYDDARFYSGAGASPTTADSVVSLRGSENHGLMGCLTPVGDVDHDGHADLAVPVSNVDDRKVVLIWAVEALSGATVVDEGPSYAVFGMPYYSLDPATESSPAGDIDGDGFDDLLLTNSNNLWFFTDLGH